MERGVSFLCTFPWITDMGKVKKEAVAYRENVTLARVTSKLSGQNFKSSRLSTTLWNEAAVYVYLSHKSVISISFGAVGRTRGG